MDYLKKLLMMFVLSMAPISELRGGFVYAYGADIDWLIAIPICIIANIIPVPFIIIFIKRIFAWMRKISPWLNKLVTKLENRANKKSESVQKHAFWGLFILVAIPLPGTGAWTGALVAAMLDMRLKKAFPAIALGVLGAAVIMFTVIQIFGWTVASKLFGLH